MRIWLLSSELPQEIAGGIARYVDSFARLAGAAGHEVTIIARTQQACDIQLSPGVRVIGIVPRNTLSAASWPDRDPSRHPSYPYNVLGWWPALSYHMAETVLQLAERLPAPDVIESQEFGALPYYLLQRKLTERTPLADVPVVVHLHSAYFDLARVNQQSRYRFPLYWIGQMEKFCLLAADAILAPSHYITRSAEQAMRRKLDASVIRLPLVISDDIAAQRPLPGELVYVGRLEVRKGVLPLVKACSRMWAEGERFRLTLIGGDTGFELQDTTIATFLRSRYSHWIDNGQLRLLGELDRTAVLDHMQQAWAVLVPSLWENFPNTCMEAMAVGQVVVASRAGGQAEMIAQDGVDGVLFDWDVPGEFEAKLRSVLALQTADREEIAQRARTRIQSLCDPKTVLAQRIEHFEAVRAQAAPRRLFPAFGRLRADDARAATDVPASLAHMALRTHNGDVSVKIGSASSHTESAFEMADTDSWSRTPTTEREIVAPAAPSTLTAACQEQARLLSIVIPYYNLGAYIGETLDNVLASTYAPLEIVLVNDGSTDPASQRALEAIEQRNLPQVRVVHTSNQGLAATRNAGAASASGMFLAFVDADDLVEPDFFARAIDVLQRYENVTLVYSWVRYFDNSSDIWPTWNAEFPYMLAHNMLVPLAVMRRSAFLQAARNKPAFEYNFEDYEGWLALVESGGVGVSLPHPLVRYRVRSGSMYHECGRNQQLYLYDLLTRYHKDAYREWGVELFNLQNANGPAWLWNQPSREPPEPAQATMTEMRQQRDKLWDEVRTLGKGWDDHVQFIKAQQLHIENLENRCHELKTTLDDFLGRDGISPRERQLGGRLVKRVRRTWLMRQVLRHTKLKQAIKRTIQKI